MTYSGIIYFYSDFVGFGWRNFDIFDGEILRSLPSDGSLQGLDLALAVF